MSRFLKLFLAIAFLVLPFSDGFAQFKKKSYSMKAKKKTLIIYDGRYLNHGWFFAPGITYMFPDYFANNPQEFTLSPDTLLLINESDKTKGKLGLYFELGRFHLLQYGAVFHSLDYSIAYKQKKGFEDYTAQTRAPGGADPYAVYVGNGTFKESFATAAFNMNNMWQISNYSFIQNSLGVNIDYRFRANNEFGEDPPLVKSFPETLRGQLHYKLGFGRKVYEHFFMVFALETPVLTVYPWNDWKSTDRYFNTQYRPVIFSVRFMFRKQPNAADCPPVYTAPQDPAHNQKY